MVKIVLKTNRLKFKKLKPESTKNYLSVNAHV